MKTFASVASLDDPQTVATVEEMLDQARGDVRVLVVLQSDDHDLRARLERIPCAEVVWLPVEYARGPCYARAIAQMKFAGEDWYYQCDAHTRHGPEWDARLAGWSAGLPERHVLSTYVGYSDRYPIGVITPVRWEPDGMLFQTRHEIGHLTLERPAPARFLGAGHVWAPGSIVRDAPTDPMLYFTGEEQSLALRLWTQGYDLFHPPEIVAWSSHLYNQPRHADLSPRWPVLDRISRGRVAELFGGGEVIGFGLGRERSLRGWIEWSGCDPVARTLLTDDEWRALDPERALRFGEPAEQMVPDGAVYLRHMRLAGAGFRDIQCRGVVLDFSHSELIGADFGAAKLPGAHFVGATLRGANFRGADLTGAVFLGADLTDADFTDADLTGAELEGARLAGVDFTRTRR